MSGKSRGADRGMDKFKRDAKATYEKFKHAISMGSVDSEVVAHQMLMERTLFAKSRTQSHDKREEFKRMERAWEANQKRERKHRVRANDMAKFSGNKDIAYSAEQQQYIRPVVKKTIGWSQTSAVNDAITKTYGVPQMASNRYEMTLNLDGKSLRTTMDEAQRIMTEGMAQDMADAMDAAILKEIREGQDRFVPTEPETAPERLERLICEERAARAARESKA